jgi:hypothetical protein
MKDAKDTSSFRWRHFLKNFSRDLLKDVRIREELPPAVIKSNWLGYEPASEQEIAALEERLGKELPPSYRSFLKETNGWRNCGSFIYRLWPCSKVRWFREQHKDWIDAYMQANGIPEPADNEYYIYGKRQMPHCFRPRYLRSALEISDIGDSAIMLLNPEVSLEDGEWEAWFFANCGGAERYRSFRELMVAQHKSFRRILKERGPGQSKYGNQGQQAALRGETDLAIRLLKILAADGDHSSAMSLAELCAFRGLWNEVILAAGFFLQNPGAVSVNQPFSDMVLLLGMAGHETGNWKQIDKITADAIAKERKREYDKYHECVRQHAMLMFNALRGYCRRHGRPPHLIHSVYPVLPFRQWSVSKRKAYYRNAVKRAFELRPDLKNKPNQLAMHYFDLARNLELDNEIIRLFRKHGSLINFDQALDVARAYVRHGNLRLAWKVIWERIHQWWGMFTGQVAPIILLIDDRLRALMTPERCELILSTPRNPRPKLT